MRRLGFVCFCAAAFGGLFACTAVLGDFEVSSSSEVGDGGPNGADVVTDGDPGGDAGGDTGADAACGPNQVRVGNECRAQCQPGGNQCEGHGKCMNTATGFACTCDKEYTGPSCANCATGYQDKNGNGDCLPDCASANLTCPFRAACSDALGTAQCTCADGYTLSSNVCSWTGVIRDPGFSGVPAGVWSIQPLNATGMKVDTTGTASDIKETGYAITTGDAMCSGGNNRPNVVQTFDMPTVAQSEPLALKVWSAATFPMGASVNAFVRIGPATSFGSGSNFFWTIAASDTYESQKFCLGELEYGKGRRIEMGMSAGGCGGSAGSMYGYIDHARIEPDATCPAVGKVFNGDFESGITGWQQGSSGGAADVLAGVGSGSSYGAQLASFYDCNSSTLTGSISVPIATTLPQASLKFNFKGSGGGQVSRIRLDTNFGGGVIAGNLSGGSGSFGQINVCLPEYAKGHVGSLQVEMPQATTCGIPQADSRVFVYDDFQIVTDPACPVAANIIDGDFERTAPGSPWVFYVNTQSMTTGGVKNSGGNNYGSISATRLCNEATASLTISTPSFNMGSFYKVQFHYRTTETSSGSAFTYSLNGPDTTLASTGGAWANGTACINFSNGAATLTFRVKPNPPGGGGNCGDIMTEQTLDLDNVTGSVVTTCP